MPRFLEPDPNTPPDQSHCTLIDPKTGETFSVMLLSLYNMLKKAGYRVSFGGASSQSMPAVKVSQTLQAVKPGDLLPKKEGA